MIMIGLWCVLLTCVIIFAVILLRTKERKETELDKPEVKKKVLTGPKCWPIFGGLHHLQGPAGPYDAFTRLADKYGDIYKIKLGAVNCVVVSSYNYVKEVLITKGHEFGGRPDFLRFHELFGGDRNNSLALCDWSDLQRTRRSIARVFCSPRGGSLQQEILSKIAIEESRELLSMLESEESKEITDGKKSLKPLLLATLANMFTRYMCSTRFTYHDEDFRRIVRSFDEIFWDINHGYAVDFLPWLTPFYSSTMEKLRNWSIEIRSFILSRIIEDHLKNLDSESNEPRDFTDALLLQLQSSSESNVSWEHIMFELEDFLGGHSAIGNLVMLILAHLAIRPEVQKKVQEECDLFLHQSDKSTDFITLNNRAEMPYTDAVIWETLRISSSPIVPHVATVDTDIDGYPIKKNTVIFINNFNLNLGASYWGEDAHEFKPERFISVVDGSAKIIKPQHFVPFSTGKRTCIGQRLVQGFAFVVITGLLSKFNVRPVNNNFDGLKKQLNPGCIAVPPDSFNFELKPREILNLNK
ncbi:cytochrome P450 307a1-like [Chelonus insularis]|uniref:cytochrome P450 307a1-like n=1 Tax=Chelonus insularis TaxID=460826 RepID=UPI00158E1C22|nr:cytochrome P450 307a1-like [Chelonus insularis]